MLTIGLVLAVIYVLSLVGCASKSDKTTSSDDENELSGTALYGLTAEVVEVLGNGRYEVEVTGEDENFAIGDIVIINYDYISDEAEKSPLKTGDNITITYSTFEKTDTVYEITPGQIVLSLFEEVFLRLSICMVC